MNATACPPSLGSEAKAGIASYLAELLKLDMSLLRGVAIPLTKRLGAATLTGSASYRVPSDQTLVVTQIHGTWRSSALSTEIALGAALAAPSPSELLAARTSNCLTKLQIQDRSLDIFDGADALLSAITPPNGSPLFFPAQSPMVVPSAMSLRATFSLQDTTAAIVGNDADYGLILTGILIPHRV